MTDREKIIKELTEIYDEAYDRWVHRPYVEDKLVTLIRDCIPDALALLWEQEAVLVEHKEVNDEYQAIDDEFVCKHCGVWWMIPKEDLKYCPGCGRKVKWDD